MKIAEGKSQEYREAFDRNDDAYGRRCFTYAEEWADLMEKALVDSPNTTLGDVVEATSRAADYDGITGFMYGAAVSILSSFWERGEELRRWHNHR